MNKNFTKTISYGRLCNQIIRNIIISLIAEKNDIYVEYSSHEKIDKLGILLFVGKKYPVESIRVTEKNFLEILNGSHCKILCTKKFFQRKGCIDKVYEYLTSEKIKQNIIERNPFQDRYKNNNDLFVHIRLGDVASKTEYNPGFGYYEDCINKIDYDKLYIGTDSPNHKFIRRLQNQFNADVKRLNEIETIQFGSTCKHIVLSHGTFSAIIGYLGYFSDVYYYDQAPTWCPIDLFRVAPDWVKINEENV